MCCSTVPPGRGVVSGLGSALLFYLLGNSHMKKLRRFIYIVVVPLGFTALGIVIRPYVSLDFGSAREVVLSPQQKLRFDAWEAATKYIRDSLKSPSTAVFPELPAEKDWSHIRDQNIPLILNPSLSFEEDDKHYSLESLKKPQEERQREYKKLIGTDEAQNRFWVRGWVDAQNAYGAVIRNHFILTMIHNDSSQEPWKLEEIRFEGADVGLPASRRSAKMPSEKSKPSRELSYDEVINCLSNSAHNLVPKENKAIGVTWYYPRGWDTARGLVDHRLQAGSTWLYLYPYIGFRPSGYYWLRIKMRYTDGSYISANEVLLMIDGEKTTISLDRDEVDGRTIDISGDKFPLKDIANGSEVYITIQGRHGRASWELDSQHLEAFKTIVDCLAALDELKSSPQGDK